MMPAASNRFYCCLLVQCFAQWSPLNGPARVQCFAQYRVGS
jgi:hypothetical protein